ncbi:MAG: alpha/beta hydrolase [Spartobacteria bacterium]|nr:alpha/beta hydrolase [Spartobacteria bacterium]
MKVYLSIILATSLVSLCIADEHVILLHGLCRTTKSMEKMDGALQEAGYTVFNPGYPSRELTVHELAEQYLAPAVEHSSGAEKIHFVTHSLGGIMLRDYLAHHTISNLGNVVMLGPPNQGSEVVDTLRDNPVFQWLNGPAGQELGTATNSLPRTLGKATFSLGIIAGDRSINWINSTMIPGRDDGKVSVARTKIEGMKDHIVLHVPHPYLMKNDEVIEQVIYFLQQAKFKTQ